MIIKNTQGFKYFNDSKLGNIYILKRKNGYCLSKHQSLASLDDILELNGEYWFSLKEIKNILKSDYQLNY